MAEGGMAEGGMPEGGMPEDGMVEAAAWAAVGGGEGDIEPIPRPGSSSGLDAAAAPDAAGALPPPAPTETPNPVAIGSVAAARLDSSLCCFCCLGLVAAAQLD